jgi:hypothetical protein
MKSKNRFRFWAPLVPLVGLLVQSASAQNVYMVQKRQEFTQGDSAGAVPDSGRAFKFSVSAPNPATLVAPAGSTLPLTYYPNDRIYGIDQFFPTKAALDAAWPNGSYRMTGSVAPSIALNLTPDNYPAGTPQVTGGTWANGMLIVDPGQTTTINLSTFAGYATSGVGAHMSTNVESIMGDNVRLQNDIVNQAAFGIPVSTTPLTSITLPAGRLTSGRVYQGSVDWDALTTLDIPNNSVVLFSKRLNFYIAAQTPGTSTPPPVITRQPTNQSGSAGGSVTFSVGLTVGGSTNFGNLMQNWYFNGQEIRVDGTKYSWPTNVQGLGLRVNDLTAADGGSYSVRLGNAGGFVSSATATLSVSTPAAPTIAFHPVAQTVSHGSTVVFSVAAAAVPAPTYQWRKDGVDILGGTSSTLVIPNATSASQGNYSVWVTNNLGSAPSNAAALTVTTSGDPSRLSNLSILTPLAAGESMTMGTVLGGAGTLGNKPLLARAVGPSLAPFGITEFLPSPALTLNYTSPSPAVVVATNAGWGGSTTLGNTFAAVGAFPFTGTGSRDSAIFQPSLAPGNYTVQVGDAGRGTGTVIAELYDATPAGSFTGLTPRLVNVSVLKEIATGSSLTAGFVIGGSTAKTVLIRAIGPTLGLAPFSIPGVMADPQLTLNNTSVSPAVIVAANNDWGGDPAISQTAARISAFAVTNGASRDAMLLITLAPGNYTAQVAPVIGTAGGTTIVEVYEVP